MPHPAGRFVFPWFVLALAFLGIAGGCDPKPKADMASTTSAESETTATEATKADQIRPNKPPRSEPATGEIEEREGIVTSVHLGSGELGGFFLQSPASESKKPVGLFVETSRIDVQEGDVIRVTGKVRQKEGMLTLTPAQGNGPVSFVTLKRGESLPAGEPVSLEEPIDWERYESVLVRMEHPVVVIDTYDLARRGRIIVAPEMLRVPTEEVDPNDAEPEGKTSQSSVNAEAVAKLQQSNKQRQLTIDDGVTSQNRFPIPLVPGLGSDNDSLRIGSKIEALSGVIYQADGQHFLLPRSPLDIEFAPRPARPELGDADVVVASFNVLNYFSTLDDGNNGARGADSEQEQQRQLEKIVSALEGLEADVIGLMELENRPEAEREIVDALNRRLGKNLYAGCGIPEGFSEAPGGDQAIRVGLIYRSDRLKQSRPLSMLKDKAFFNARTPLSQTFELPENGFSFNVVVNHFKSKGSRNASAADKDQGDGQSAYNASRRKQAEAIAGHVRSLEAEGQPNVLVIGDLNAYSQEDPIDVLRAAGLVDLTETACKDPQPYTYIYYGQAGCIDHSFATPALADQVTALAPWNINSPEPRSLDYNTEYNPTALYKPDAFRSSDHDPVLIGIQSGN